MEPYGDDVTDEIRHKFARSCVAYPNRRMPNNATHWMMAITIRVVNPRLDDAEAYSSLQTGMRLLDDYTLDGHKVFHMVECIPENLKRTNLLHSHTQLHVHGMGMLRRDVGWANIRIKGYYLYWKPYVSNRWLAYMRKSHLYKSQLEHEAYIQQERRLEQEAVYPKTKMF